MLLPVVAHAERVDSLRHNDLGEAQVTTIKSFNPLKGSSAAQVHWDMKQLQALPQILGNADPIRYLQTLPSVQTSTEYDAGLHVQGCNNGQNAILLGKAVVYNPSHLMGIFSTFNSSHFKALHFTTQSSADSPSRLGGVVQMELPSLPIENPNIITDNQKTKLVEKYHWVRSHRKALCKLRQLHTPSSPCLPVRPTSTCFTANG